MEMLQLIVECAMDEEREQRINSIGTVKYRLPMINSYVIEIPAASLGQLVGIQGITSVQQTARITAQMKQARKALKAESAYGLGVTGKGVGVAILDTGIAPLADFTKPKNRIAAFHDVVNGRAEAYDDNGHGTHVACRYSYRWAIPISGKR